MTIPIYRHNQDHDDWEVASVYDSDDCDSLGRSAYDESLHSSGSPALHPQGRLYDDTGALVRYSVPQQQHQHYSPVAFTRPRLEPRYVPGKQNNNNNNFVVPPPGVIFPPKDRALSPRDTYWPPTPVQMATSSSKMPMDKRLLETPSPPPPPSLLLSPSSPPPVSSPLIRRPSPATTIAHGQPPHGTSIAMSGSGTGTNVISHASPMMAPPPRYHEVAHPISPRLAEAGRQAHSDIVMSPPRRSGHGILSSSSYASGPGRAPMPWGAQSSEGMTLVDGRYGAGHPSYGPAGRTDAYPVRMLTQYEYDAGGRTKPQTRERKGSIWRRFVRRFGPSQVSVGQT